MAEKCSSIVDSIGNSKGMFILFDHTLLLKYIS
jgi:hypothetical protein